MSGSKLAATWQLAKDNARIPSFAGDDVQAALDFLSLAPRLAESEENSIICFWRRCFSKVGQQVFVCFCTLAALAFRELATYVRSSRLISDWFILWNVRLLLCLGGRRWQAQVAHHFFFSFIVRAMCREPVVQIARKEEHVPVQSSFISASVFRGDKAVPCNNCYATYEAFSRSSHSGPVRSLHLMPDPAVPSFASSKESEYQGFYSRWHPVFGSCSKGLEQLDVGCF